MEIYERIRYLRKNVLDLSQTEFGARLGVSRSVINNIESNVLARPDQKLSLYKLICSEFGVREDWLLNGIEPMYVEPDSFSLDEFARSNGATDLELDIVRAYFELDSGLRHELLDHFRDRLTVKSDKPKSGELGEDLPGTAAELEDLYLPTDAGPINKTGAG